MISLKDLHADLDKAIALVVKDRSAVIKSRKVVDAALSDGKTYYGINTGFGFLANKRIDADKLEKLQKNLLLSHAVGLGDFVPKDITRLMLKLKVYSLSLGYSGVSLETFDRLLMFIENDWISVVPSKGSLGASWRFGAVGALMFASDWQRGVLG